jgi:peptidyl-prolyl cis-trans isomerase B (cyclophilin B)
LAARLEDFSFMKAITLLCALGLFAAAATAKAADTTTNAAPTKAASKSSEATTTVTPAETAAPAKTAATNEVAVITTSEGVMVLEFYPDVAPHHVENFKKLARQGFYNGQCFHRVIKGFMIQGGDPNTKDESKKEMWGMGGPGYTIDAEFNSKHHARGTLSMARTQDPNSAGSQFFICHGDAGFLDHQYTVFGNLIKGYDVLDKIATTPTEGPDRPVKRVTIESIKIVPADSVK